MAASNTKQNNKATGSLLVLKILVPIIILVIIGFVFWSIEISSDPDKPRHQMADGVAKFYATFRKSFGPGNEQLDEYTIKLPEPEQPILKQLQQRGSEVNPGERGWTGETKRRSFKENDTIKSALEKHAADEGVALFWDLEYDYIIKHHFEERVNLTRLMNKVTSTVNNDYDGQVKSYFCHQERAIVITASDEQYLNEFCDLTISRRQQIMNKHLEAEYKLKKKLGQL